MVVFRQARYTRSHQIAPKIEILLVPESVRWSEQGVVPAGGAFVRVAG